MQSRAMTLTFHGVGEPPRVLDRGEADVWVSKKRFVALLDAAAERDDVRITFDDGNVSDLEHALPGPTRRGPERDVLHRRRPNRYARLRRCERRATSSPQPEWRSARTACATARGVASTTARGMRSSSARRRCSKRSSSGR